MVRFIWSRLVNAGVRPAINVGLLRISVGGSARLTYEASRRAIEIGFSTNIEVWQPFAQFGSDLDEVQRDVEPR